MSDDSRRKKKERKKEIPGIEWGPRDSFKFDLGILLGSPPGDRTGDSVGPSPADDEPLADQKERKCRLVHSSGIELGTLVDEHLVFTSGP